MKWILFLDDIRVPADVRYYYPVEYKMVICRSYDEAVDMVNMLGAPSFISFDHDLADEHYDGKEGHEKTGYEFAKWFCNWVMDNNVDLGPANFDMHIHSMNPVGAENIRKYMSGFLQNWSKTVK